MAILVVAVIGAAAFYGIQFLAASAGPDFRYRVIDNGDAVEIRSFIGTGGTLEIPSHIRDLPVTRIHRNAFSGPYAGGWTWLSTQREIIRRLDAVTIPDTVTHIGRFAFMDSRLRYVHIPDSVVYIGRSAFEQNHSLTAASVPYHTYVHAWAFGRNVTITRR